jgi:branched-chain amino acid transport system ATP-binding protein
MKTTHTTSPSDQAAKPLLEAHGVGVQFRGLRALNDVDFQIEPGEIVGIIGPNGAGKTTLINVLSGFVRPVTGRLLLGGDDITKLPVRLRARSGLARTFQDVRLFKRLSVLENVEVAAATIGRGDGLPRTRAMAILEDLGLAHRAHTQAGALPFGAERLVSIARALAGDPNVLLLDEPAAGLDEQETDELTASLKRIRSDYQCALGVVEHDMRLIMDLCDRVHVLNFGETVAIGPPDVIRADPAVLDAYLGSEEATGA